MRIALVAALTRDRVIGRDNALPWHLPNDLRRFRKLTVGKPILMGRRTWESIGRPLPDRTNLVLTRRRDYPAAGARVIHSVEAALAAAGPVPELMVIGGADLFRMFLPWAGTMYLTWVDADVSGDVYFPEWDPAEWTETFREPHAADSKHPFPYTFENLTRRMD